MELRAPCRLCASDSNITRELTGNQVSVRVARGKVWFNKSMERWRSTEEYMHILRLFTHRHNGERRVRKEIDNV